MTSPFCNNTAVDRLYNQEGVEALFRRIGGWEAQGEIHNLIYRGRWIEPTTTSQLDGQAWWTLRDIATWVIGCRPTAEGEKILRILQVAEARHVPS